MSRTAFPTSKQEEVRIAVEADDGDEVTGRILDVLGEHDQFPTNFWLTRNKGRLELQLGLVGHSFRPERLGNLILKVPGVKRVATSSASLR